MTETQLVTAIDQRILSDRRAANSTDKYEEERRYIDRRTENTPELLPTAWPFSTEIAK